jgi:tetratricopeptide (TPR) repeat protein
MTRIENQPIATLVRGLASVPSVLSVVLFLFASVLPFRGAEAEPAGQTLAERTLRRLVEQQRDLFALAAKQGDNLDDGSFRQQMQALAHDYELLVRHNPNYAAAFAAYGYFLSKTDMRKEAAAILLKANQLDPDIALVKNQLGNLLAEDGKPLQAAPYFIAAIKLEPKEPLYHYQLGTLLAEARDVFLKAGEWTRETLEQAMHEAFRTAAGLAPERFEFAYRYAESFYDLEKPDWDTALKLWSALEEKAPTAIERQTMRLHAANICLKLGRPAHAEALLATVDEPKLQAQKQKLVAQMPPPPKN